MLRSFVLAGLLAGVVAAPGVAAEQEAGVEAIYAYAGRYTFRIDARNRHYRSIHQGQASAYVTGNQARVQLRAEGYREETAYVSLRENQTTYDVRMTCDDPDVWVDVKDQDYGNVQASARADNFSVWADQYRFVVTLQEEGFDQFTAHDVDVRVNGMFAFGERIQVYGTGYGRRVEVTLKRRDIDRFSNRVRVQIPDDESLGSSRKATRARTFEALHAAGPAE